ncbi:hypothetical protein M406DRAFT_266972 [Cryphonectria parasitica EP155]|uniref:Uncharacterized protein n=1 Tax=Cryphonectria parasitica (strain ATCC 38755 / EP155) TaxID=660469 RepID=A0A9P5CL98_CRYP1|nr:uncharacterized protein M406DRAFT_266972 [Cryphonectria parasitica EP155]KAF3762002.1 hypothetical protein M406DRAFT_266972 [Cryphonectria parasitica EP155]
MSPELSIAKLPPPAVIVEDGPTTPMDAAAPNGPPSASQQSLPSTEPPASPADPELSFKTERNDERAASASSVIPSSLTPPPSSQVPSNDGASRAAAASLRQRMLSPPVTGLHSVRPNSTTPAGHYAAPRPEQVVAAPPDELRAMLQTCIAEQSRLKMEAAHHKLQYQLLSVRADEDAHRAAVEQEMTLRQLQALQQQKAEAPRRVKRTASPPSPDITPAMYDSLRALAEKVRRDNEKLLRDYDEACKRLKAAKRLIMRQEESIDTLREDNKLLRDRLLDKRELWDKLASPGGMFHTPKTAHAASPVQHRQTPRRTPKHRVDREAQPFAVLLQAATQENSSVPSTPVTPNRAISTSGRHPLKHSRGAQSMSSLPSTPNRSRPRGADLLPPPDLVPHTEPPRRFVGRSFVPDTPERELSFGRTTDRMERGRRHSRESTISADDNETLARANLESVAQQANSFVSRGSPPPRPRVPLPTYRGQSGGGGAGGAGGEDAQIYESQASQEATSMLRRDPRESFEVASSHGSRDVTPTPTTADKKLQSTLRGPLNKPTLTTSAKRKLDEQQGREPTSPTKKLRMAGGLREGNPPIGLGLGIRGD